ncbi:MFS transporter, partial [Candidatus Hodarchaeum mangrovi]
AKFRRGLFYSYLSIYLRNFLGMSVTETTLFATLPMILNVFFQMFVWGVISDRYQRRRTFIVIGEVLGAVGTILVFHTHRTVTSGLLAGWIIIIGLSIIEIFWSMSNTGWTALISDIFPYAERSKIQGNLSSLGGIGRIVGVWVGGLLYDGLSMYYEGWGFYEGILFYVAAGVMILSAIPMFFMPEGGIKRYQEEKSQDTKIPNGIKNKVFFIFLIAMIFINFGRNSVAIILSLYLSLEEGFNLSSQVLSYIINTQSLAIILTGIFVGGISSKLGTRRTLIFGALIAIFSLIMFSTISFLPLIYVASFLRGCADVIVSASSYTYASRLINPKNRARYFGYYNATFFLSWGLAGTIIVGPTTDLLILSGIGSVLAHQLSFLLAAGITFIGVLILILILSYFNRHPLESIALVS